MIFNCFSSRFISEVPSVNEAHHRFAPFKINITFARVTSFFRGEPRARKKVDETPNILPALLFLPG